MDNIQIKSVMGHVEVIINGMFSFSADNEQEAIEELKSQMTCWLCLVIIYKNRFNICI